MKIIEAIIAKTANTTIVVKLIFGNIVCLYLQEISTFKEGGSTEVCPGQHKVIH